MRTSHVAELLPRMMRELGLDPASVGLAHPEVFIALQVACDLCEDVGQCRRSLREGVAHQGYELFCLNAPLLKALGAAPGESQRYRLRKAILATVPKLRALALSICGNIDDADDLVQETLTRGIANLGVLEDEGDVVRSLSATLRRVAHSEQKFAWPAAPHGDAYGMEQDEAVSQHDPATAMEALRRVLPRLPADERVALMLLLGQGLSPEDAADVVGASAEELEQRTERGLAKLATLLSPAARALI